MKARHRRRSFLWLLPVRWYETNANACFGLVGDVSVLWVVEV